MSARNKRIESLAREVRRLRQAQNQAESPWERSWLGFRRWALMLAHEFVRDEVKIRAESLAFLMLFSLLPLIAGCFFVFNVLAQFGMVQDALRGGLEQFLSTIPGEHRAFVEDYVIRFKDAYLESLSQRSGTIGIFALFILIWIGLSTFDNVERTLNHIWSSDKVRPFLEKVRNFLVVVVAAPITMTAALSLPLILKKIPATDYVLQRVPLLSVLLNAILVPAIVFGTFALIYRFVPVRRVYWRSALGGALFATIFLQLVNALMRLYFQFGTQSAYGKAAIVPLLVFWMYIVWIVVIMGAEVSFLMQSEREILQEKETEPTLREGAALVSLLVEFLAAHRQGTGPLDFEKLRNLSALGSGPLQFVLDFLQRRKLIVPCFASENAETGCYILARDISEVSVGELLQEFFAAAWKVRDGRIEKTWVQSLEEWLAPWRALTFADCLGGNGKRARKG